jgi:hypothetical protein
MTYAGRSHNVRAMTAHAHHPQVDSAAKERMKLFRDLRRSNEYAARVAQMLETQRQRRIERVLQAQRALRRHRDR